MKTVEALESYYAGRGIVLDYLIGERDEFSGIRIVDRLGFAPNDRGTLDPSDIDDAIDEVSRSSRVIDGGGQHFEIATANNNLVGADTMLHISTYSSAISTNYGNGYEFAAQAVRYPSFRHLYVASFGNGSTSPLLPKDAAYARKTGRFTKGREDGLTLPIESIENLYTALGKEGLGAVSLMGTDSAGGQYARALSVAMESGQLSNAFFSESSGFVNLSAVRLATGMLIKENMQNARRNSEISPDSEKMGEDKIGRFAKIYEKHADLPGRRELVAAKVGVFASLQSMYTSLQALKRGPSGRKNPLAHETSAVVGVHPDAELVYGVAEHDPLYKSPEKARAAAELFLQSIEYGNAPVKVAIIPGMTHAYNTHFPDLYHAIKRHALEIE